MTNSRRTSGVVMMVAGALMLLVTFIWNDEANRTVFLLVGAAFLAAGAALAATSRSQT